jgi:hypothetical protein
MGMQIVGMQNRERADFLCVNSPHAEQERKPKAAVHTFPV